MIDASKVSSFGVKSRSETSSSISFGIECRLIVELDGGQHNEPDAIEYDERRTAWLESEGFLVLRYWNHEILEDWQTVEEVIWHALQERRGSGQSQPRGV